MNNERGYPPASESNPEQSLPVPPIPPPGGPPPLKAPAQVSPTKVAPSAAAAPAPATPDIAGTVSSTQALYDQWQNTNKELQEALHHTPKYEQTNPIESLASIAGIFALFGGAMMRNPALGMLSAAKGILEGQKQNDLDKYNKAMQEFQANREYLTTVSGNLAKQIQLIQQNQHYTNQQRYQQESLLLRSLGISQRGASMMAAADRHAQTMARQDNRTAFTTGMKLIPQLPADKQAEAVKWLSAGHDAQTLTMTGVSKYLTDLAGGKLPGKAPTANQELAKNWQILSNHFKVGGKADPITIAGVTYTQKHFDDAHSNAIILTGPAANVKAMMAATPKVPVGGAGGSAPVGTTPDGWTFEAASE